MAGLVWSGRDCCCCTFDPGSDRLNPALFWLVGDPCLLTTLGLTPGFNRLDVFGLMIRPSASIG